MAAAALLVAMAARVTGQELPLKRQLPGAPAPVCASDPGSAAAPTDDARDEASRLAAAATQASLLGDQARARDLLSRAASLDPTNDGIAYRLARTLDELDDDDGARAAYCRYLALAPEAPDATDIGRRLRELGISGGGGTSSAETAFREGVAAYETGNIGLAVSAFTAALLERPDLAAAYYNRALASEAQRRPEVAATDLERYLELEPEAADRDAVRRHLESLREPRRAHAPGTALVAGLVVPGLGHFYAGRPVTGFLVLGLAAGAAAFGAVYRETDVLCAGPSDPCPSNQVLDQSTERPYLVPGLVTAAGIGILGAVEAYLGARRRTPPLATLQVPSVLGARIETLAVRRGPGGVDVQLFRLRF